ncbi:MAG: AAA family ATPase [Candidatus Marinimicrobia bacterium]|nr:AAA family ATPase [Candidatus Neomarinimicrobiota bacterium]
MVCNAKLFLTLRRHPIYWVLNKIDYDLKINKYNIQLAEMTRDSQVKSSKGEMRRSKRLELATRKKLAADSSSDDDGELSNSDNDEMDVHEYRKFLSKIFPSKHLNTKIRAGDRLKKIVEEIDDEVVPPKKSSKTKGRKISDDDYEPSSVDSDEDEEFVPRKPKSSKKTKPVKKSKRVEEEEDSDDEDDDDEDYDEDDDDEPLSKNQKLNIIFTIGGMGESEDEWEDYDSEDEDEDDDDVSEDEDIEVSTDEDEDEYEDEEADDEESQEEVIVKKNKKSSVARSKSETKSTDSETPSTQSDTLVQLKKMLEANPTDKSIQKCIDAYEEDIHEQKVKVEKKEIKQKDKNMRIFKRILKDKNTMNDFAFYEKLDMEQQKKIIKEAREINKITRIEKPYRMTLLESTIPVEFKSAAMKKINSLKSMEPGSGEFYKSKNWVDTFMRIPFNKHDGLPISIDDGVDKCHEFMENAQKTLDAAVYGLNDAKMQIMQMLGQLLTNPKAIGTAIAIHGPPGTGKTSLVKEGISKILNRPFAFIALGGATDSSFLDGHGYTYEGSTWGKIVQILIDSKCMNPVFYFDELDKISDTPRGEEIAGILTHLTDTSQNSQFHDKYFAEINFDLSKCLFIFSYNDEHKVSPILKDRMYRIKTKGYSSKEKTVISNNYLLPKIREQVRFNVDEITIPNDVISHIIDTHCNREDGVRNLKRCLEIIHTKLNLYRLMRPGTNLFEGEMSLKVEFPFLVTKEIVDKLIKRDSDGAEMWRNMVV